MKPFSIIILLVIGIFLGNFVFRLKSIVDLFFLAFCMGMFYIGIPVGFGIAEILFRNKN